MHGCRLVIFLQPAGVSQVAKAKTTPQKTKKSKAEVLPDKYAHLNGALVRSIARPSISTSSQPNTIVDLTTSKPAAQEPSTSKPPASSFLRGFLDNYKPAPSEPAWYEKSKPRQWIKRTCTTDPDFFKVGLFDPTNRCSCPDCNPSSRPSERVEIFGLGADHVS